jgi:hypothetical protein
LTTKTQSLKFESKTPWSTARISRKPRKAQEVHLEEGKVARPIKDIKSGKSSQNDKEEIRKAQKHKRLKELNPPPELNSP